MAEAEEALHIWPSDGPCEVHAWPTDGLPRRLVTTARERYGKGGLNVCRACVERAWDEVNRERSRG